MGERTPQLGNKRVNHQQRKREVSSFSKSTAALKSTGTVPVG
jgi:hypothetical protein